MTTTPSSTAHQTGSTSSKLSSLLKLPKALAGGSAGSSREQHRGSIPAAFRSEAEPSSSVRTTTVTPPPNLNRDIWPDVPSTYVFPSGGSTQGSSGSPHTQASLLAGTTPSASSGTPSRRGGDVGLGVSYRAGGGGDWTTALGVGLTPPTGRPTRETLSTGLRPAPSSRPHTAPGDGTGTEGKATQKGKRRRYKSHHATYEDLAREELELERALQSVESSRRPPSRRAISAQGAVSHPLAEADFPSRGKEGGLVAVTSSSSSNRDRSASDAERTHSSASTGRARAGPAASVPSLPPSPAPGTFKLPSQPRRRDQKGKRPRAKEREDVVSEEGAKSIETMAFGGRRQYRTPLGTVGEYTSGDFGDAPPSPSFVSSSQHRSSLGRRHSSPSISGSGELWGTPSLAGSKSNGTGSGSGSGSRSGRRSMSTFASGYAAGSESVGTRSSEGNMLHSFMQSGREGPGGTGAGEWEDVEEVAERKEAKREGRGLQRLGSASGAGAGTPPTRTKEALRTRSSPGRKPLEYQVTENLLAASGFRSTPRPSPSPTQLPSPVATPRPSALSRSTTPSRASSTRSPSRSTGRVGYLSANSASSRSLASWWSGGVGSFRSAVSRGRATAATGSSGSSDESFAMRMAGPGARGELRLALAPPPRTMPRPVSTPNMAGHSLAATLASTPSTSSPATPALVPTGPGDSSSEGEDDFEWYDAEDDVEDLAVVAVEGIPGGLTVRELGDVAEEDEGAIAVVRRGSKGKRKEVQERTIRVRRSTNAAFVFDARRRSSGLFRSKSTGSGDRRSSWVMKTLELAPKVGPTSAVSLHRQHRRARSDAQIGRREGRIVDNAAPPRTGEEESPSSSLLDHASASSHEYHIAIPLSSAASHGAATGEGLHQQYRMRTRAVWGSMSGSTDGEFLRQTPDRLRRKWRQKVLKEEQRRREEAGRGHARSISVPTTAGGGATSTAAGTTRRSGTATVEGWRPLADSPSPVRETYIDEGLVGPRVTRTSRWSPSPVPGSSMSSSSGGKRGCVPESLKLVPPNAWLFAFGFLFFPLWYVGAFWPRLDAAPRHRRRRIDAESPSSSSTSEDEEVEEVSDLARPRLSSTFPATARRTGGGPLSGWPARSASMSSGATTHVPDFDRASDHMRTLGGFWSEVAPRADVEAHLRADAPFWAHQRALYTWRLRCRVAGTVFPVVVLPIVVVVAAVLTR